MKKMMALILCLILVAIPCAGLLASAEDDLGYTMDETNKAFTVSTPAGLNTVAALINTENATYGSYSITLTADLEFTSTDGAMNWTPIASDQTTPYTGTFDGAGHTIKGLITDTDATKRYQALIGVSGTGCVVKNLTITDSKFEGREYIAAVIGFAVADSLTVQNVHVSNVSVTAAQSNGNNVGGICGRLKASAESGATFLFENCTVKANMSSYRNVAGICGGEATSATIPFTVTFRNCVTAGNYVTYHTKAGGGSGPSGIFGYHGGGTADEMKVVYENCVSIADLTTANDEIGASSYRIHSGVYEIKNCIFVGSVASILSLSSMKHTVTITDSVICNPGLEADGGTASVWENSESITEPENATITIDGTAATFAGAALPTVTSATAKTRATEMFSSNETVKTIALALMEESLNHTHVFDQQVIDNLYLKDEATCQSKAVYYYSCTCGLKGEETFEYGEIADHTFSEGWAMDETSHWHICTDCQVEKSEEGEHTFGDWTVKKEATERREGERVRSCTVCGYEESETIAKLTPETTETTTTAATEESGGGCASTVTGSIGILMAIVGISGGLIIRKKKED